MKYIINTLFLCLAFSSLAQSGNIKGITVVAPPSEIDSLPFEKLTALGTSHVKLVPYGFTRKGTTSVIFNISRQWWGEKKEGVVQSIKLAQAQGLKILLKPQVYIPGGWVGEMEFKSNEEWEEWEESYTTFIQFYLDIAIEYNVDLFCIGTEYKSCVKHRPAFWSNLIDSVRSQYQGKICYSANWDNYENIPFWDKLDYIGISSYFPLNTATTPEVNQLIKAWKPIVKKLRSFSKQYSKQILFTEYGYLSVDGCAGKTWLLEKKVFDLNVNQIAQANALEALYTSFWNEKFWAGGFLWKWFPDMQGHEGYPERDYTPQGKLAIDIIKYWFIHK